MFFPGEFHGQRNLVSDSPWGHEELDMIAQLTHTHIIYVLIKPKHNQKPFPSPQKTQG